MVIDTRHDSTRVGTERCARYRGLMTFQRVNKPPLRRAGPETRRVLRRGDDALAVATERRAPYLFATSRESRWRNGCPIGCPVSAFQSCAVASSDLVRMCLPSGLNAALVT